MKNLKYTLLSFLFAEGGSEDESPKVQVRYVNKIEDRNTQIKLEIETVSVSPKVFVIRNFLSSCEADNFTLFIIRIILLFIDGVTFTICYKKAHIFVDVTMNIQHVYTQRTLSFTYARFKKMVIQ